ncbi:helix-turn-helix domain-containing protein [Staphylospora marina]|uniref:helix-turn-helix domain-containing protein n=1 Tax=Staphylospora marina TaxID=2490858 RepID=UPI000F5BF725|nr:helix-turn-helix domain-containing protein [Staphylospora marina]
MAGIGNYLRQVREQQGYTLEEMNRMTNIHIEYLQALENDQFELLPSPFYAKAFLRTYSKCLGLDAQPLLEMYEQMMNPGSSSVPATPPQSRSLPEPEWTRPQQTAQRGPAYRTNANPRQQGRAGEVGSGQTLPRSVFGSSPSMPVPYGTSQHPVEPAPVQQNTQRFQPLSKPAAQSPGGISFPAPQPQPLAPRKAVMEAKQSLEDEDSRKPAPMVISAAVAALLLVGGGIWYFSGSEDPDATVNSNTETLSNGDVSAGEIADPMLEPGEIPDDSYMGQLYYLTNASNLEVVVKGKSGESIVMYAPTAADFKNGKKNQFRLRVGEERRLDATGLNEIWFRLSVPSNVQVTVNGVDLSTDAQDTEQSYRIKLKK